MKIPANRLAENILRRVIEEYVSRDGTDWSDMDDRIREVAALLETGGAELHFDEETQTTNIVMSERL